MSDATCPPLRMRYSFEARCRAVGRWWPARACTRPRRRSARSRATGYRWWWRFRDGGWGGLQERRPIPRRQPRRLSADSEAEIVAARERSGAGPLTIGALIDRPASTVEQGAAPTRALAATARATPAGGARTSASVPENSCTSTPRSIGRFWHVGKRILRRRTAAQPARRLAARPRRRRRPLPWLAYAEVLPTDRTVERHRVP